MSRALAVIAVLVGIGWAVHAVAQTAISADGVVESTTGGFKFPDGTVQASAAVAGAAPVEDTGQTLCYDPTGTTTGTVPCATTGQDGELQAGVAWPTPRFTDQSDGTVTDNLTGLVWLKDANCILNFATWSLVLDWVTLLNTTSMACTDYAAMTFTDWRLPNIKELLSLVDYSQPATPLLPPDHPFIDPEQGGGIFWSSSSEAMLPSNAWTLEIRNGKVISRNKSETNWVWPVRGGQ